MKSLTGSSHERSASMVNPLAGNQTYLVGGAVRDALMGLPVQDRDWVVVGATAQTLLDQGYMPVGRDFPVFLHPTSKEEYALARTERNTAPGYRGFTVNASPEVTLEEDLQRRDLTINAMAVAADHASHPASWLAHGALVDPYGGRQDLANKLLRHVSLAFCEDPVRILRLARFAARFTDFGVAPETMALMRRMVASGETDHLVAERVWQELSRGLMEKKPSRMFGVLRDCGALQRLLPELDGLWKVAHSTAGIGVGTHTMQVLDASAGLGAPLAVRFACLVQPIDRTQRDAAAIKHLCERLRVPVDCKELAEVVAREQDAIHASLTLDAPAIVHLLERCDAFRKPARFSDLLLACACAAQAGGDMQAPFPPTVHLRAAWARAQSVATDQVAAQAQQAGASGQEIGEWIRRYRTEAVERGDDKFHQGHPKGV